MIKEITNFKNWEPMQYLIKLHTCDLCGRDGQVSEERVTTYFEVLNRIEKIYSIMEGVTLKDLPMETQTNLFKHKGEEFGKLYRDAMISHLKHGLKQQIQV